jgi:hypothetical protein
MVAVFAEQWFTDFGLPRPLANGYRGWWSRSGSENGADRGWLLAVLEIAADALRTGVSRPERRRGGDGVSTVRAAVVTVGDGERRGRGGFGLRVGRRFGHRVWRPALLGGPVVEHLGVLCRRVGLPVILGNLVG